MKHLLTIMSLIIALNFNGLSQTYRDFPLGTDWHFSDARTLGMGGTGVASLGGSAALFLNPATIGKQSSRLAVQLHPGVRKLQETRAYPLYNRIDDVINNSIYAANNHYFPLWQGGISWKPAHPLFHRIQALAVGVFTEKNMNYKYTEEVRQNIFGDSLLARNKLAFTGVVYRYTAGAAIRITRWLNFGLQLGVIRGNLNRDSSIVFYRGSSNDVHSQQNWDLQNVPVVASLGFVATVNPHLFLGSVVQLPYTMEYQIFPENSRLILQTPTRLSVGLEYRARQELQTRLNLDFTYAFWSKTRSTKNNQPYLPLLQDSWALKAGLEHIFYNQIPFRVGLQYRTSKFDRRTVRTAITAGTGFMGDYWRVDVAGGFSSLEYTYPDLFDDALYGGSRVASPMDQVRELLFFGMATVTLDVGKLWESKHKKSSQP